MFLEILQNSQENACVIVLFSIKLYAWGLPEACNFIKKETLAQVFSCEFCKISENTFFTEHLRTTASISWIIAMKIMISKLLWKAQIAFLI